MKTLNGYRMIFVLICLTLVAVLTIGNVKASPTQQGETDFIAMDAYVSEQMNNLGIPGMAMGIVQDGQIVHLQGFGAADSFGRAVTPQTPFHLGSVTKSFTALAVMQLVEEGKIDLDAPVQTYLPWFELADKEAPAEITVRHLLNQGWESLLGQPARVGGRCTRPEKIRTHTARAEGSRPPVALPSGFLIASVEDMAHYAIAQLKDGRYGDKAVLSPQGIAVLQAPAISAGGDTHYAMGWNVGPLAGVPAVWHDGDDGRNSSIVILMPDRGSGVILLSKASGFEHLLQINEVGKGVVSLLNGMSPAPAVLLFPLRFLYWTILLTPLLQILGIVFVWRKRHHSKGWHVLLTVILNLAVVILLFGLAQNIPSPLRSILVWFPEVGHGLIIIATLGIGWSLIYTVMYLRMRKEHSSEPQALPKMTAA